MSENIKVVCRVRPLNDTEVSNESKVVLSYASESLGSITIGGKSFGFDHVFKPQASQVQVYDVVAKPIVDDVLSGYNGTIFAYGQTASGKTYTMEGLIGERLYQGIIPRIVRDIFHHIYQMDENLEFHIKVSYFEIYMDKIRDLLDVSKTNLSVHEDKNRVPYVKGATERFVSNPDEVFEAINDGKLNRHVSVTNMNEHSSRSHSVFMIQVRQENLETRKKLHGKLCLVDLAGSEKVAKTGAEGTVLDEAKNINRSLSALGNVINALVEGSPHVPYRDSKLTRILQESLGGNARTTMVICVSPASFNESETRSTLFFGMRAKTITNQVSVNVELTTDEWRRRYEREVEKINRLKTIVAGLQQELKKWRSGEKVNNCDWFTDSDYRSMAEDSNRRRSCKLDIEGNTIPTAMSTSTSSLFSLTDTSEALDDRVQSLYRQLDEKDDEIGRQTQFITRLQEQLTDQDDMLRGHRKDNEKLQEELSKLQVSNDSSRGEVKEVLQALEELAVNYEQKNEDIGIKTRQLEEAQEQLIEKTRSLNGKDGELHRLRDHFGHVNKKYREMMNNLVKELGEVGEVLSEQLSKPSFAGTGDKIDEEFTVMRIFISKLKSEAKNSASRLRKLEDTRSNQSRKLDKQEQEAKQVAVKIQELEFRLTNMTAKLDESEARKRELDETMDNLSSELSKSRANEQLYVAQRAECSAVEAEMQTQMEKELSRQSEQHSHQVRSLRKELELKQSQLTDLQEKQSQYVMQLEHYTNDVETLSAEKASLAQRAEKAERELASRETAWCDLRDLEDTVMRELRSLQNLRRLFVEDLQARLNAKARKKEVEKNDATAPQDDLTQIDEDNSDSSTTMTSSVHVNFLENNLEQLTKVHKQLVRDNSELRNEIPKMERRLRATMDRVNALETALREAKEVATKDRMRYQSEVERVKEAVRQRSLFRRGPAPVIAKPVRAGQPPVSHGYA